MNRSAHRDKKEISALTKTYDLIVWMIPTLEKFPKSQRFLLGDRIQSALLDILEFLIRTRAGCSGQMKGWTFSAIRYTRNLCGSEKG